MDWEKVVEFIELCNEYSYDSVSAFVFHFGEDYLTRETFESAYIGHYDSEEDYAMEYLESSGQLDLIPSKLQYYFNYERYAYDLFINDFFFDNKTVFFRH